jgi:putative membrane protein
MAKHRINESRKIDESRKDEGGVMSKTLALEAKSGQKTHSRSLMKGLLAGLIGGLAATAAKRATEKIFPPKPHGEPEPPSVLVEKIFGHRLEGAQKLAAMETIHWGFGAATGAAYGALAEYYPAATAKDGAAFGMALTSLTRGIELPALGIEAEPENQTFREKSSELATHVVYGVVTETVRRVVRKILR